MRSASTVSGPLLSISTPASQQNRFAAVYLLTGQLLYFIVEGKSRVKEVYSQLAAYMRAEGMQDTDLFALAFILDDEYFFADPESKLSKYSPKSWKSSSTYGLDQNGQPLLQLHLRVKFYVDTTKSLSDELTRQHYYLQLRKNIADRGGTTEDGYQNVLPLVALGLQTDLGDHTADADITSELLEQYLPSKVYKFNEHKVKQTLCGLYKSHKGLSKSRAQSMFVQETGPIHRSHLYRLRLNKSQPKQTQGSAVSVCNSVWLAICTNGIQLFHENLSQSLSGLFLWNNIVKLCFDRKKFELRPSNADRLIYYTNSDEKSKRMLALCRETHQFCMTVHPRLLDICFNNNTTDKLNAFDGLKWTNEKKSKSLNDNDVISEKKCENGVCSDSSISTADQKTCDRPKKKESNGTLLSGVELDYSHTAQNSTVSDLDYSVQSAQDSSDAYLMYRHPRARTTTYVANSNQSAHTSSGVYTCASYSTASKDTASASYTTENCSSMGCNDNGGVSDNGYKTAAVVAAAAQSAALSSAEPPDTDSAYSPSLPPDTIAASSTCGVDDNRAAARQPVTAIDDCDGGGVSVSDRDELYDLSAVVTSDSSYCVGGGATTATTASDAGPPPSSKCGNARCGNRCNGAMDGYTEPDAGGGDGGDGDDDGGGGGGGGVRSRSGSVVSNSGSFRGDGSDPSEGGRGALLSADDLSDLIVGRKSLQTPRKGFYPSRPTTSSTLDSDSDYVTLPPPNNFVTGAPSLSNLSLANFDYGSGSLWEAHRSFDLAANVAKLCGGGYHNPFNGRQNKCIVNSNNYLDVHKSGNTFHHPAANTPLTAAPPAPHLRARQPPPPPPPPPPPRPKQYAQQLAQYKQQLRSDVDFVVYPLKDPAVSRQEYADARMAHHRHQEQYKRHFGCNPPAPRSNAHVYRSTPNVAAAVSPPLSSSSTSSSGLTQLQQFLQQQRLDRQLMGHHRLQKHPPPPLPPMPPHLKYTPRNNLGGHDPNLQLPLGGGENLLPLTSSMVLADIAILRHNRRRLERVSRTYSHDDLLSAAAAPTVPPKLLPQCHRRRPPPPPPPSSSVHKPAAAVPPCTTGGGTVLDIESLREKSKTFDLPLIAALCNDQTLLKQTNALITNKSTQTAVAPAVAAPSSFLGASSAHLLPSSSHLLPPAHLMPSDLLPSHLQPLSLSSSSSSHLLPPAHLIPPDLSPSHLLPSYILPSASHLLQSSSHLLPSSSHLLPSSSHLLPSSSHLLPSSSHLLQSSSHLLPSSSHLLPSSSYLLPSSSSSLSAAAHTIQPPTIRSAGKSNCTRCTNGTSSYSSPTPPSFLSAAASSPAIVTAADMAAKSKTNHHVKTNINIIQQ